MQRTWLEQPKRPLDINFDIKSIRNQVKDRCVPCLQYSSNSTSKQFNSYRKESLPTVPSFDNLQARIREFSYSRLSQTQSQQQRIGFVQQPITYSPQKAVGMQQKISNTLGSRTNLFSLQSSQNRYDYQTKPLENEFKQRKRNLADNVQLNEIISLRNKIESTQVNRKSLGSNYVSELVKLAQAITNALK